SRPAGALTLHGLNQGAIAEEQVIASKRRDLILRKLVVTWIRSWGSLFRCLSGRTPAGLSCSSRHNARIMNRKEAVSHDFHFRGMKRSPYAKKPCAPVG